VAWRSTPSGWQNGRYKKQLQVIPGQDGASLCAVFIDQPVTLGSEPLSFTFGLNATPVRPEFPEYRLINRNDAPVALNGGSWAV